MKKLLLAAAMLLTGASAFAWNVGDEITDQVSWGNLSFESNPMDYWTIELSSGSTTQTGGLFEVYDGKDVDLYQYVQLKAGMYRVECQGYYRCGNSWADDPSAYNTADWQNNALLYVQNGAYNIDSKEFAPGRTFKTPLMPRLFEEYNGAQIYEDTVKEGWDMSDGHYNNESYWGPCSVPGSLAWFNAGHYQPYNEDGVKYNTVTFFLTEDGYARIGISKKDPKSADSFMVTNFKLYYEGEAGEAAELMALQDEVTDKYSQIESIMNNYVNDGLIYTLISDALIDFDGEIGDVSSLSTKDECSSALAILNELYDNASAAAKDVDNLKSVIKVMEILYNTTDYAGKNQFGEALKAAQNCLDSDYFPADDDDFTSIKKAYDNVCAARITYLMTQEPVNGSYDFSCAINFPWFCNNEYSPKYDAEKGYYAYNEEIENTWVANYGEKSVKEVMSENPDYIDIASDVTWTQKDGAIGEWIFNHHVTSGWMGGIDNVTMQHGYTAVGAWSGDPVGGYQEMRQVVSGLPNGYYSMGAFFINAGNDPHEGQYVYICAGDQPNDETMEKAQFTHKGEHWWWGAGNYPLYRTDDWQDLRTNMIKVEDGKVVIGSRSTWFYAVTGFRLYYYGETPDFTALLSPSIQETKDAIAELSFPGDITAANAMLAEIPENVEDGDTYASALATISTIKSFVSTAKSAEDTFTNVTLNNFAELVDKYAEGSAENEFLSTAYVSIINLGENENDTYKDAIAIANDYNAYVDYLNFRNAAKNYESDANVAAVLKDQATYLTANYANAAKLAELKAQLAAPYNKALMAKIEGFDKASESNPVDVTALIINPNYDELSTGWSGEMTVDSLGTVERWNVNCDISQTIYALPAGAYQVQVQAFYRDGGDASKAYNNFWYDLDDETGEWANPNAKLYANSVETSIASICSESFTERSYTQYVDKWVKSEEGDADGNDVWEPHWTYQFKKEVTNEETGEVTYEELTEETVSNDYPWDTKVEDLDEILFFPASLRGTACRFANSPKAYVNKATVMVEEGGSLTIGIRKETLITNDWVTMDNWKLFYLGKEVPTSISNAQSATTSTTYNVGGVRQSKLQKGINILKQNDGTVRKVYVK